MPPATVFDKPVYSPFYGERLDEILREREIETLVVSGAETDVCVVAAVALSRQMPVSRRDL